MSRDGGVPTSSREAPRWHGSTADERQTQLFFGYLKECLANGLVSEALVKEHMAANHVRHDAFEVIGRTPPVEQVLPKAA